MSKISNFFMACTIFAFCQSASIVERINTKCEISDADCWLKFHTTVLREAIENGLPEMNVPPLDPYVIKDVDMNLLGLIKFTIVDGNAKGIQTCHLTGLTIDMSIQRIHVELSCEKVSVEGRYSIATTEQFKTMFTNVDVHGDGNGGATVENLQASLEFDFVVKKHDNGQLYYEIVTEDKTYTYKIGKLTVSADNIYIGTQEISGVLTKIFNENSEFVVKTIGNVVGDKIVEEIYKQVIKFYNVVSISQITSGDLSSYVKS